MPKVVITLTLTDQQLKDLDDRAKHLDYDIGGYLSSLISDDLNKHLTDYLFSINAEVKEKA